MKQVCILSIGLLSLLYYNSVLTMEKKQIQFVLSEAHSEPSQQKSFYDKIQKDTTALTYSNEKFIQYLADNFKIHPVLVLHDEDGVSDKSCCLGKEKNLNEASRRILGMIIQAKAMKQECAFKSNHDKEQEHSKQDEQPNPQNNLQNIEANLPILVTAQRAVTERYISVKTKWLDAKDK